MLYNGENMCHYANSHYANSYSRYPADNAEN